jgi:uncharacterized repeat protein (TIGR01451 family)
VNPGHPIAVTAVGAFNAGGAGFTQAVTVGIFASALVPGTSVTLLGTNGTLVNGDRFITLPAPVVLAAPQTYSVVANYNPSRVAGPTDSNGNQTLAGWMMSTENTGGGAIKFIDANQARFDGNPTLDFPPASPVPGFPTNGFNAGTFIFAPILAPTLTKVFGAATIDIDVTTTLTFTLTNPAANPITLTGLAFTDTLPAGLIVDAAQVSPFAACGGTVTATPLGNSISLAGGTLAPGASCTFTVNVHSTSAGVKTNTTSTVTSNEAPAGTPATAVITVRPVISASGIYQLRYLANLDKGDSYVNLTNAGTLNGFDPAGRICVNVYTFDPAEELISCCACPVTPNGLNSLSARNDLISNTLTPGVPTSITVKLVASVPLPGNTCDASSPNAANLVRGMRAWATTLHLNTSVLPAPGVYQDTETPFTRAELSLTELAKLTSFCGFIQANGSGFGICKSCRAGALGSEQK